MEDDDDENVPLLSVRFGGAATMLAASAHAHSRAAVRTRDMRATNPNNLNPKPKSSLIFNLSSISAENRRLLEQLYDNTTKKHQEMTRAIELFKKNEKLKRQLQETEKEAKYLRQSNIKLRTGYSAIFPNSK
ncbi:jg9149 [Pararge aegeria aegeria]|uniref:Jg9149 protein n=1 Tax=Pararge aegeria aegeria TaxID=348720 RepID=A0A8S4QYW0_9NEOP|nr:jg9149 [Pararge aegeria aegeria]